MAVTPRSDDDPVFRHEVRAFLAQALPAALRRKVMAHEILGKDDFMLWHRALARQGWLACSWPREYGGPGWSTLQIAIFEEECWLAGAPEVSPVGLKLLGPVLMRYGSAEQKAQILPRILQFEDWWAQGYSEPGAGSDLASLKMRGRVEGDELVVSGQKTWTTYGQYANRIFCLVRTDPEAKAQEGISFVLFDMDQPGITLRPIILLEGTHEVNEVFFDEVRVPLRNVVGELNQGWTYAKALLGHERFQAGKIGRSRRELLLLKRLAALPDAMGRRLIDDARFAERVAVAEVDQLALEQTALRLMGDAAAGRGVGTEPSILKIRGTEIAQQLSRLLMEVVGPFHVQGLDAARAGDAALPTSAALVRQYLNWRKLSIYGGSNEVQRNIIAKFGLGL